jgi:hypothetical protein
LDDLSSDLDEYAEPAFMPLGFMRLRLLDQGYEPTPLKNKRALVVGWPYGEMTRERVVQEWRMNPTLTGTGLRTGKLVVFDCDLIPEMHSRHVEHAIVQRLGTPLRRLGSKGRALLYRIDGEPISKIIMRASLPNAIDFGLPPDEEGKYPHVVEVLGAGQHMAAFGYNERARRNIRWHQSGSPLDISFDMLTPVTADQIVDACEGVIEAMLDCGYDLDLDAVIEAEVPVPERITGAREYTQIADTTQAFLDLLPPGKPGRDGSIKINCPLCGDLNRKGSFLPTATGGFRYKCWRASCDYSERNATGWEPRDLRPLGSRELRLFTALGGDPDVLPKIARPYPPAWLRRVRREIEELESGEAMYGSPYRK